MQTLLKELNKDPTQMAVRKVTEQKGLEGKQEKVTMKPVFRLSEDMDRIKQLFRLSEQKEVRLRSLTRKMDHSNYSRKIKWDAEYYKNRIKPREMEEVVKE